MSSYLSTKIHASTNFICNKLILVYSANKASINWTAKWVTETNHYPPYKNLNHHHRDKPLLRPHPVDTNSRKAQSQKTRGESYGGSKRRERDAMTGMRSPPMSTLMCCIPPCHPLAGRKAQFTGSIVAPLFLHDLSLRNDWFSPSRVPRCGSSC